MDNHVSGHHQKDSGKNIKNLNGTDVPEKNFENGSNQAEIQDGNGQSNRNQKDVVINTIDISPRTFLELLPSKQGTLLAAAIANIMTEGLNAEQQNILGNFVSVVGALISYKASRDELNEEKQ